MKTNVKLFKKITVFALVSCLLVSGIIPNITSKAVTQVPSQTSIVSTTTDYLTNPIGIDTEKPIFGWRMESNLVGQQQNAYEINLYDSTHPDQVVWTSGKVDSNQSQGILYGGDALKTAMKYTWQVKVWATDGQTYTSEVSTFETGVTGDSIWNSAEFLQLSSSEAAPIFRTEKALNGKVKSARLYITALGAYEAYINGETVGAVNQDGTTTYHHMNPGYGNTDYCLYYQTYDVTTYLANDSAFALSIIAGTGWFNGMENTKSSPAVKAMLTISYEGGDTETIITNTTDWKGTLDGPITKNGIYYGEDYDARKEAALGDYKNPGYDDSSWLVDAGRSSSHVISNAFENTNTRFLRLDVTEVGPPPAADLNNRLQIMELELFDPGGNNLALGKLVKVSNNLNVAGMWTPAYLTDGDDGMESDHGYTSNTLGSQFPSAGSLLLTLDLGTKQDISQLKLHCRTKTPSIVAGVCTNHPRKYSIQVSDDGLSWTDLVKDYDAGEIKNGQQTGLHTTSYNKKIIAQRGESGQILESLAKKPVTATLYTGERTSPVYEGGEIIVDSHYAYEQPANELYNHNVTIVDKSKQIFDGGIQLKAGQTIVMDLGQNLAGIPNLEFASVPGARVDIHFGEMINDGSKRFTNTYAGDEKLGGEALYAGDGPKGSLYTKNLLGINASCSYTFSSNEKVSYQPKLTFFGYQYMELTATQDMTIYSITSKPTSSVSRQTGFVETNNEDINQLFSNALWGQLSNYFTMPTDCPQRGERKVWIDAAQEFAQTGLYNFDSYSFLNALQEAMSEVTLDQGFPGATLSQGGWNHHWAAGWSDAEIIMAWTLYDQTGDTSVIQRNWKALNRYMDFLKANERSPYQSPAKRNGVAFGDWLAFQGSSIEIMADYYYGYVVLLMAEMAEAIGNQEDTQKYKTLAESIKEKFIRTYITFEDGELIVHSDGGTGSFMGKGGIREANSQTALLWMLKLGFYNSNEMRDAARQELFDNIRNKHDVILPYVKASSTYTDATGFEADKAFDGDRNTRWNSNYSSPNEQFLEISFEKEMSFNKALIVQSDLEVLQRVKSYRIEYYDGTKWKTFVDGGELQAQKTHTFDTVTAKKVRLLLNEFITDSVTISEFQLFNDATPLQNPRRVASIREDYEENTIAIGFLGSNIIAPVLSDAGGSAVAYDLLLQDSMPSWLYSVKIGATTIWERWNSYTTEDGFGNQEMNSFNHYSFGSIAEWMYRYMVGIESDPTRPGFQHTILQPTLDTGSKYNSQERIDTVSGSYESYYGKIQSNWHTDGGKLTSYEATVPANTTATLYLPVDANATMENLPAGVTFKMMSEHNGQSVAVLELTSGGYQFKVENNIVSGKLTEGYVTGNPSAEKTALEQAIEKAEKFSDLQNDYTAASWNTFTNALEAANAALQNEKATQNDVDGATEDLESAVASLKAIIVSVESPDFVHKCETFTITVTTDPAVTKLQLYNEASVKMGITVTEKPMADGNKVWEVSMNIGTVGMERTFTFGATCEDSQSKMTSKTFTLDVLNAKPASDTQLITSAVFSTGEGVVNENLVLTVTTDISVNGLSVYNENNGKIGIKSTTKKDVNGVRTWTLVLSVGTKGDRIFTVKGTSSIGTETNTKAADIKIVSKV